MDRMYPSRPMVGVGVVVLNEDKLLLTKRLNEPGRGMWSIPGGLVELGEKVRDAAVREVYEECGLKVEIIGLVDVGDIIVKDEKGVRFHYVIVIFKAKPLEGNLRAGDDVAEVRWVCFSELHKYRIPPVVLNALKKIRKF